MSAVTSNFVAVIAQWGATIMCLCFVMLAAYELDACELYAMVKLLTVLAACYA